ncbi:MAG: metallophosphoesterase [Myxococcales bacterium]|nr:metallophosphoesterase [Myxococcales bacterium]
MKNLSIEAEPFEALRYLNAGRRGPTVERLPIHRGRADGLPDGVDAVLCASDLQGMAPGPDGAALLGVGLAARYPELADRALVPRPERTGVFLAGDLWADPLSRSRGGFGPVDDVWAAFASRFAWVTGVAGNHDDVSLVPELDDAYLLDGEVVRLPGLIVGGVGGIIGEKKKPGRRSEGAFFSALDDVLVESPDVVVLHEGPEGDRRQRGHPAIGARLRTMQVRLTICGHVHWAEPLATLGPTGQVLNVDGRAVVLERR